jgi:hypothetical protein
MGVAKQTSLVHVLCKLHNYCIDEEVKRNPRRGTPVTPPTPLQTDNLHAANYGGVDVDADGRVGELLDGGEHLDDLDPADIVDRVREEMTPRQFLKKKVEDSGSHRPLLKQWKHFDRKLLFSFKIVH